MTSSEKRIVLASLSGLTDYQLKVMIDELSDGFRCKSPGLRRWHRRAARSEALRRFLTRAPVAKE